MEGLLVVRSLVASTRMDILYIKVAGGGTGDDVYPPTLYVADIENTHFNNVLIPLICITHILLY